MYRWSSEREPIRSRVPAMAAIALLIAVVGVLGLGIFPGEWVEMARASVIAVTGRP